jgi:CheY-like chemotaxis protein
MAMMHVAMSDAVNSVQGRYTRFAATVPAAPKASPEAAAAAAAREMLLRLYPGQKAKVDEAYAVSLKSVPDGAAGPRGATSGPRGNVRKRALCWLPAGYRVLEASNGIAASELLEAEKGVRLLFTDVGLPGGLNGRQLADEARRRRPDLLVLFTTGYTRNAIIHQERLDPGAELIGKPFTYATLVAKIQRLLRRAA